MNKIFVLKLNKYIKGIKTASMCTYGFVVILVMKPMTS